MEIIANQYNQFFKKDITVSKYKDTKRHANVSLKDGFSTTNHQLPPKESSTNENQRKNEPKLKCWLC